jgi:hypothetical protein
VTQACRAHAAQWVLFANSTLSDAAFVAHMRCVPVCGGGVRG